MGFWASLTVEVIGGFVTAVVLGVGAALYAADQRVRAHDEAVDDLFEDNRRWFRDRDRQLTIEKNHVVQQLSAQGQLYSGAWLQAMTIKQQAALHDYRDEISAKRRRYRLLREAEGRADKLVRRRRSKPAQRFALSDEERAIVGSWRADVAPTHMQETATIDDPTSVDLEPDLRRFEAHGDP